VSEKINFAKYNCCPCSFLLFVVVDRLEEHLGSGQFGEVYTGSWYDNDTEVKVAVKTLKKAAGDDDRVKFLQEAVIMSQFKDLNVVTMHGLVAEEEPVRNEQI